MNRGVSLELFRPTEKVDGLGTPVALSVRRGRALLTKECPMLVLTRGYQQELVIGSDIRVRIGEVSNGRVKLLIEAPRDCRVLREEVFVVATAAGAAVPCQVE
jgi:carbon storage regulator